MNDETPDTSHEIIIDQMAVVCVCNHVGSCQSDVDDTLEHGFTCRAVFRGEVQGAVHFSVFGCVWMGGGVCMRVVGRRVCVRERERERERESEKGNIRFRNISNTHTHNQTHTRNTY